MKNLYKYYLFYLYYVGVFWGYVTFTYDSSSNKFVSSKKRMIWNRVITFFVFYSFFKSSPILIKMLSSPKYFNFQDVFIFIETIAEKLCFLYILVVTSSINQHFLKLANRSEKLLGSVELQLNAQTEITKRYLIIFVNDIGAYLMICYIVSKSIGHANLTEISLEALCFCLILGFKHLQSSYIFVMLFAAQLIKKINRNIDQLLSTNLKGVGKMESKNCAISLEHQAILYEEVIKFVQKIHSLASFMYFFSIVSNMREIVYLVGITKYSKTSSQIFFCRLFTW